MVASVSPCEKNEEAKALRDEILRVVEKFTQKAHAPQKFIPGQSPVPVTGKVFGAEEVQMLVDSALDFWLTTGRFNAEFEKGMREFLGVPHVLTCNSGSSANLLALSALTSQSLGDKAIKRGDEVITCATGFPTTVNPILQNGCVPVFVDVDIPTYNIDVCGLESALSGKTKAIMIAHALGNPFDLGTVMDFAKQHDLYVIEDCCDALGATYDGKLVGTFGHVGSLSFYPAHHITMGEGGAVFTQNAHIKRALESIRDWGRDCWCSPGCDNTCKKRYEWQLGALPEGYDHKYTYSNVGYNLKITDMQAAVGCAQMKRLSGFIEKRRANFAFLSREMKRFEDYLILPEATPRSNPSWFGFPIALRDGQKFSREELLGFLNEKKIGTRLLFGGNLVHQPYMKGQNYRVAGGLENSDKVMKNSFWIGCYPGLDEEMLGFVVEQFGAFLKQKA